MALDISVIFPSPEGDFWIFLIKIKTKPIVSKDTNTGIKT